MIKFTHDFRDDLKQLYFKTGPGKEPYALCRFADGEYAFCRRRPLSSAVGEYQYKGEDSPAHRNAMRAITSNIPGLYLGISCPCCDLKATMWYRSVVRCPPWQLTYANIVHNANYQEFRKIDVSDTVLVSCFNGDFTIPEHATNPVDWDYRPLLKELFKVDKTILISAGPMKCGLIYDYWTQAPNRQIIVDVGSAMDWRIHPEAPTRDDQKPGSTNSLRVCRWNIIPGKK